MSQIIDAPSPVIIDEEEEKETEIEVGIPKIKKAATKNELSVSISQSHD